MSRRFEPSADLAAQPAAKIVLILVAIDVLAIAALLGSSLSLALAIMLGLVLVVHRWRFITRRTGVRLHWSGDGALTLRRGGAERPMELLDGRLLPGLALALRLRAAGERPHWWLFAGGADHDQRRRARQRLVVGSWRRKPTPVAPER